MTVILDLEVRIGKDVKGEVFYDKKLPNALRAAQKYAADSGTFVANMPLLLKQFPHKEWYTANSEEHSGIDKYGRFVKRGGYVVITLHGGKEGIGLLTPEVLEKAYDMKKRNKGVIKKLYAAKFNDLFDGKDVLTTLIYGRGMPDGSPILVIPYSQLVNEGSPGGYQRYAVVRPLELARKTDSGYKSIDRLTNGKGKVTDSQVITYAGGVKEGQNVIDRAIKNFKSGKLRVSHPFNSKNFDPNEPQGRLLFLNPFDYGGLIGDNDLNNYGRVVGVVPEAHGKKSIAAPKLEQILAIIYSSEDIDQEKKVPLANKILELYNPH